MGEFDLTGALRRIRRRADLSQRELAAACHVSAAVISHAESGRRGLAVDVLARAAALAGLRLGLLDGRGREVSGMDDAGARNDGGRRFPAHLDTRYGDEGWWYDVHRYGRPRPWYTFDRARWARDLRRKHRGIPDDHHVPRAGDSPEERAAARRAEALRRHHEETRRRFLAGDFRHLDDGFDCLCPPECEHLDDRSGPPVHTEGCGCHCDVA